MSIKPKLVDVPCNLCGSLNFNKLFEKIDTAPFLPDHITFSVSKCKDCGMIFSSRRVKDLDIFSSKSYYHHTFSPTSNYDVNVGKAVFASISKTTQLDSGNIIDIGAGNGRFLKAVMEYSDHWKLYALDLENCLASDVKNDITFFKTPIESCSKIIPKIFDIANMVEVAEHLIDPKKAFSEINGILKVGGWLHLSTGNVEALLTKSRGSREPYFMSQHFSYWSPNTIRTCLEACGFKVVKISNLFNGNWQLWKDTGNLSYLLRAMELEVANRIHFKDTFLIGGMRVFARKYRDIL